MQPNNSSDSQYVLWTVPAKGAPTAVGGFDIEPGHTVVPGRPHPPGRRARSQHFAVSKEPGRRVPTKPTVVLATGAVKSRPHALSLRAVRRCLP